MRIAVPDFVSNSYFPAIAAVELGFLAEEGIKAELELLYPVTDASHALREGRIDLLAGAAHAPLYAFPQWHGARLLATLSRNMYWFLVVRADMSIGRGELSTLQNLRIGAAPGPDLGLFQVLSDAGVDIDRADLRIGPVPADDNDTSGTSFGISAARALSEGTVDAFWANGMGAEVAVREGAGKVVVDARRDGGPSAPVTFPALMATDTYLAGQAGEAAAAVRAIVRAQDALRQNPALAGRLGERLYPPLEASLIATLVERDADFYHADVREEDVAGLNRLALNHDLLDEPARYDDVVATEMAPLWSALSNP